jgi:hypothetical protein
VVEDAASTWVICEKIGDDAVNPPFIVTEPGVGYRLVEAQRT